MRYTGHYTVRYIVHRTVHYMDGTLSTYVLYVLAHVDKCVLLLTYYSTRLRLPCLVVAKVVLV